MQTRWFFTVFVCTLLVATELQFIPYAAANSTSSVYSLEMPEEQISYTVSWVDGSLWAKVDGTYPLAKSIVDCEEQPLSGSRWFTLTGDALPMVYPTPPGTTNISLEIDNTELEWSNYTQTYPAETHYTAIGDWTMINCTIHPVSDQFVIKIHYEHPIQVINGSYAFLYDLNISPYLSPWSNKSTAQFTITFETNITDLQARTIATDGTLKTVDYTVTEEDAAEMLSLQVVSEYAKPLPGDLLITFNATDEETQRTSPDFLSYVLVTVIAAAVVVVCYLLLKHRKGQKQ
jgi:hypothetical protein